MKEFYKGDQEWLKAALLNAIINNDKDKIEHVIEAGADIAGKGQVGKTALHIAVMFGRSQTCVFLIEQHAKAGGDIKKFITIKDNLGKTALYYARGEGHTQMAQFLVFKLLDETFGNEMATAFMKSFNECIS